MEIIKVSTFANGEVEEAKGRLLIIRKGNGNRPFFILLSVVVLSFQLSCFRFSCCIFISAVVFFQLLCFWLQLLCHVESSLAAITHGEDNSSTTAYNVTAGIDGRL